VLPCAFHGGQTQLLDEWKYLEPFMRTFLFELCAGSLEAARTAESGGANRIELCADLSIGGVTPDFDLMKTTIEALTIPVHVLIRPRGGDFVFSAGEFCRMQKQIEEAKQAGAAGVALGVLCRDGRVDVKRSRELVELARPMAVTFHRAFDETPALEEALEALIEIGVDCLLTSGGQADVQTGAESIARLSRQAGDRIQILVEVLRRAEVTCLHGSLTKKQNGQTPTADPVVLEADVREAVRLMNAEFKDLESPVRVC
jgi:copper homeostasis protein